MAQPESIASLSDRCKWCPIFFNCSYDELNNAYLEELLDAHIRYIKRLSSIKDQEKYICKMTNPIWAKVIGYYAEISSNAQFIRSTLTDNLLNPTKKPDGYWVVSVKEKKSDGSPEEHYTLGLHRAMALAFIPNPINKREVNHIDGCKGNNLLWNLEWVTHKENQQHAFNTGLNYGPKGVKNGMNKYTEEQIHQVCQLLQDNPKMTYECISKITGVDDGTVSSIYEGKRWNSIASNYDFPDRLSNKVKRGEESGSASCTNAQVEQVCQLLDQVYEGSIKMSHKDIAEKCSVTLDVVRNISKGGSWKSISENHIFYQNKFNKEDTHYGSTN